MEKTTVYIPSDLQRALREEGKRSGRAQAELIREALGEYFAKRPRPLPRSIGIVASGEITGREAKAWVRREWAKKWARRPGTRRI